MSLSSLLLAFAPTIAARFNREDPTEDPARAIGDLEAQRDELLSARDDWRARAEAWRERAMVNIPPTPTWEPMNAPQPAGPDFRPPQIARAQELQWAMAQAQAQLAALSVNNLANQALGAQNLALAPEWCNCVPARHDMFLRGE